MANLRNMKIGEQSIIADGYHQMPDGSIMKDSEMEEGFIKRSSETLPQEAIATLNFAIRKATTEGAKRTTETLIRIRTEYMEGLKGFEGDFQDKNFKPILKKPSKRRYS